MATEKDTKVNFTTGSGNIISGPTDVFEAILASQHITGQTEAINPGNNFRRGDGTVPLWYQTNGADSGIVIGSGPDVVAVVKTSKAIPKTLHPDGSAEFGGNRHASHIEGSMERVLGMESVQRDAQQVVDYVRKYGILETATVYTGLFAKGIEIEGFAHDPLEPRMQEELGTTLWETQIDPSCLPNSQAVSLARETLRRKRVNGGILSNTSMPMVDRIDELELNNNPDGGVGSYIRAYQNYLLQYFFPQDEIAKQAWDFVAQELGHQSFLSMRNSVGNLSPWAMAAAHVSTGLFHRKPNGSYYTATEEAIAIADMYNSTLAAPATWMTFSTPFVSGIRPQVTFSDGSIAYPKDVRGVLKFGMQTAYPGDFIKEPENLRRRVVRNMISGTADRLDRASYNADFSNQNGIPVASAPSCHGAVRNRMAQGNGLHPHKHTFGRVEFTGSGSTPDISAIITRNALLTMYDLYTYMCLSEGRYPIEAGKHNFPAIAQWKEALPISHEYNFSGTESPAVQAVIGQNMQLIEQVVAFYGNGDDIQEVAQLAGRGLERLGETTVARTLDNFLSNPEGSISDVLLHMAEDGMEMAAIEAAIDQFQVDQSWMIMQNGGDILNIIGTPNKQKFPLTKI